ncbi:MAG TPA: EamA family transporter [Burkholderiales bacterium]|nr:EamA family transporter [Burkholderiales bacterium]
MNSPIVVSLWMLNALVDTGGQLAFKAASREPHDDASVLERWRHMLSRPWIWIGVGCFAIEFVLWLAFLSLVPLAVAVMLGMISIALVMLGGRIWFREPVSRGRLAGVVLILIGIALVAVS